MQGLNFVGDAFISFWALGANRDFVVREIRDDTTGLWGLYKREERRRIIIIIIIIILIL